MKNHGMNPYLPSWEYVPDGEPHVFGKRVYVYGSHDRFAGYAFCQNDYVCWSAPVDDLTDWQYEGIIYTRAEAAHNEDGRQCLYAPDVTCGPDGRYYLYYALNETSAISVAVCDTPAGKYTYYGDVHYPDGTTLGARPGDEPHVFGKRVYVYGSHDRFAGYAFCQNDYVCWSAPVDDLTDWQYEGIIYTRAEAAHNEDGRQCLYAPDVTCGPDGRYYLYYALNETSAISVAVCDTPAGKYTYYGDVHYPDGTTLGARPGDEQQFDPGVLTEGKTTWLYSGFCPPLMPGRTGALCYRLASDMLTVEQTYPAVVPGAQTAKGTGFEGHAFFEASSIRKVGDTYYFIYSSELSHELCYAVSDSPCRGFVYGGTLVDNADLGLCDTARYFTGNNHGSIEQINGRWYVFYHRHTNSSLFCRQGMVEPIEILPDGRIPQVEITTSGPNGAPLPAVELRELPAYAACNLYMTQPPQVNAEAGQNPFPYITQDGADVMPESESKPEAYICNLTPGTVVGFKYLNFQNVTKVSVKTRGMCYYGGFDVLLTADGEPIGTVSAARGNEWTWQTTELAIPNGISAIYFRMKGYGTLSLAAAKFH